jgi:uncharacterized protein (TIRG00374 family)
MKLKKYIGVTVGVILVVVLIYTANIKEIIRTISGLNRLYLLLAFVSYLPLSLLRPLKWKLFIKEKTSYKYIFKISYLGYVANRLFPSRLGALLRAVLLSKKYKFSMGFSVASIFLDNIIVILYISLSSFIISSLFVFKGREIINQMIIWPIVFIVSIIGGVVVLYYILKSSYVTKIISRVRKLDKLREKYGVNIIRDFKNYFLRLDYKNLACGVLVTAIIWFNMALVNLLIIKSSGNSINFVFLYLASTLPAMIGIVTMIPGGFGTQEISIVGILVGAGLSLPIATSVALLNRFIEMIWIICFGVYSSVSFNAESLKK